MQENQLLLMLFHLSEVARAYREMIRTGEDYAMVEAVFELSENKMKQLETNESILVITRQINLNKSSECRINGKIDL